MKFRKDIIFGVALLGFGTSGLSAYMLASRSQQSTKKAKPSDLGSSVACRGNGCRYAQIFYAAGGRPYCGGRHGHQAYLKNNHRDKTIHASVRVIFDGNPGKVPKKLNVPPQRSEFVGCSKWQGDGVPPQYYRYEVESASLG